MKSSRGLRKKDLRLCASVCVCVDVCVRVGFQSAANTHLHVSDLQHGKGKSSRSQRKVAHI